MRYNRRTYPLGGLLSGAASGASLGTSLGGPWGTAIGAGLGAVTGLIGGNAQKRQEEEARARQIAQEKKMAEDAFAKSNKARLMSYDMDGVSDYNFYPMGGMIRGDYEVEGGEVVQGIDTNLESGQQLASDVAVAEGPTHQGGGVEGQGGERVFSDRIPVSSFIRELLKSNGVGNVKGKTYAEVAEDIGKKKGKFEEKASSSFAPSRNTSERMLARLDNSLDLLFDLQQTENGDSQGETKKFPYGGNLNPDKFNIGFVSTGDYRKDLLTLDNLRNQNTFEGNSAENRRIANQAEALRNQIKEANREIPKTPVNSEPLNVPRNVNTGVDYSVGQTGNPLTRRTTNNDLEKAILLGRGNGTAVEEFLPEYALDYKVGQTGNPLTRTGTNNDLAKAILLGRGNSRALPEASTVVPEITTPTGNTSPYKGNNRTASRASSGVNPATPAAPAVVPETPPVANLDVLDAPWIRRENPYDNPVGRNITSLGDMSIPTSLSTPSNIAAIPAETGIAATPATPANSTIGRVGDFLSNNVGHIANLANFLGNNRDINNLRTDVRRTLVDAPVYNYRDRSGTQQRELGRTVNAGLRTLGTSSRTANASNVGALISRGMDASNRIALGEAERRDNYDNNYNRQVLGVNSMNAQITNQANDMSRDLDNRRTSMRQQNRTAFTQGILGNLQSQEARRMDRTRMNLSYLINNENEVLDRQAAKLGMTTEEFRRAVMSGRLSI